MTIRISKLRLTGATSTSPFYEVSFEPKGSTGGFRPLSVIAGPSLTGKTTVVDFIGYCLGGKHLPMHDEVQSRVRGALLETELRGVPTVIERSATGTPSAFAAVWDSTLENIGETLERRVSIEPTGDPEGLSQLVLAASNLDGVRLVDSTVKNDTGSAMLSIRDLFRVMVVTNDRLDSRNLVYERENFMVTQKYQQTIEVMFGVYDSEEAIIKDQLHRANQLRNAAKVRLEALTISAERDHPDGSDVLQSLVDARSADIAELNARLKVLDHGQRTSEAAATAMRRELEVAQRSATAARVRVRDRESLLDRLEALREQYFDDRRKLDFLADAELLFDPLRVTVCPVCFNPVAPQIIDGECSLCHHELGGGDASEAASHGADSGTAGSIEFLQSERRAVRSRIRSLTEYIVRLQVDGAVLVRDAEAAARSADKAAAALDGLSRKPAPWLALRDQITSKITDAKLERQAAEVGVKAWMWVEKERVAMEKLQTEVDRLGRARRRSRPDRESITRMLSTRFSSILAEIGYPKLSDAYIGLNFVPHVRGMPYTHQSSGGMVVIALAWNLALWEIAHEEAADAPGLLIIDSPQKNLGHNAGVNDDFADAALVERFYAHVKRWLASDGAGAQLIVVDNSPPESVSDDVVLRFTRRAEEFPYGLIHDATS